jgi:hypothetical protein
MLSNIFHAMNYVISLTSWSRAEPAGILLIPTANSEGLFPNHTAYGDLARMTIFHPSPME